MPILPATLFYSLSVCLYRVPSKFSSFIQLFPFFLIVFLCLYLSSSFVLSSLSLFTCLSHELLSISSLLSLSLSPFSFLYLSLSDIFFHHLSSPLHHQIPVFLMSCFSSLSPFSFLCLSLLISFFCHLFSPSLSLFACLSHELLFISLSLSLSLSLPFSSDIFLCHLFSPLCRSLPVFFISLPHSPFFFLPHLLSPLVHLFLESSFFVFFFLIFFSVSSLSFSVSLASHFESPHYLSFVSTLTHTFLFFLLFLLFPLVFLYLPHHLTLSPSFSTTPIFLFFFAFFFPSHLN